MRQVVLRVPQELEGTSPERNYPGGPWTQTRQSRAQTRLGLKRGSGNREHVDEKDLDVRGGSHRAPGKPEGLCRPPQNANPF